MLTKEMLLEPFVKGIKSRDAFRVGMEYEFFLCHEETGKPIGYDVIESLFGLLCDVDGWSPVREGVYVIALSKGGMSLTLEPGGQFEISTPPYRTLHEVHEELVTVLRVLSGICQKMGIRPVFRGFHPTAKREEIAFMPKVRYDIMKHYMSKKGDCGLDMMLRTTGLQVAIDYESEEDMVLKYRLALLLSPFFRAVFASSPFCNGEKTPFVSYRGYVWDNTDAERCGIPSVVFSKGFGFCAYVDYLLGVPMYFVMDRETGVYHDVAGSDFSEFLSGKLSGCEDLIPKAEDWEDHIAAVFPEVRLRPYLELRSADGGTPLVALAYGAFIVGIFYHEESLQEAWDMVKGWQEGIKEILVASSKEGLDTSLSSGTLREVGKDLVGLAVQGLEKRGKGEEVYLEPMEFLLKRQRGDIGEKQGGGWEEL